MTNARTISLLAAIMCVFTVSPAYTQYMYLDSNGDGLNDAGDVLNENGTATTVRAYLVTNRDRVGTVRSCGDSTVAISLLGYAVNLQVTGGTATFDPPTSAAEFQTDLLSTNPNDSLHVFISYGAAIGGGLAEGGPHLLFSITVTGQTFSPRLDIVPEAVVLGRDPTYFATECLGGYTVSNLWYLTANLANGEGEWTDVDGIASFPLTISAPESVSTEEGAEIEIQSSATGSGYGGAPTVTAQGFPASLSLEVMATGGNTSQATLSGELGANDAGIYTIVWTVSEPGGASAADTTVMDVTQYDFPPLVSAPPIKTVQEGAVLTFTVRAEDPDYADDISSFTADLSGLPSGHNATFTNDGETEPGIWTGTFSWTPAFNHAGTYTVTFTALSNAQSGSGNTTITVVDAIDPMQAGLYRIQLPGPEYEVDAKFYGTACPQGQVCEEATYFAGDSGQVYVPLRTCFGCAWWGQIHLDFPGQTRYAFIRLENGGVDALAPSVDLNPGQSFPGYNYTPPADPSHVYALNLVTPAAAFSAARYGFEPPKAPVTRYWTPTPGTDSNIKYSYSTGINWPASLDVYLQERTDSDKWVMAHEYAHHVQRYALAPLTAYCVQEEPHGASYCDSVPCALDAWMEGMADGMAEFYTSEAFGFNVVFNHPLCASYPRSPSYEHAVSDFVYAVCKRDSRAFMDTWLSAQARFTENDLWFPHRAGTVSTYYALWNDEDPAPTEYIVQHHPGPFSIDIEYVQYVLGNASPNVTSVEDALSAAGSLGIRRISPSPASSLVRLEIAAPKSALHRIQMFDVNGRLVRALDAVQFNAGLNSVSVDLGDLVSGVYFVRLIERGRVVGTPRRVVVVR